MDFFGNLSGKTKQSVIFEIKCVSRFFGISISKCYVKSINFSGRERLRYVC